MKKGFTLIEMLVVIGIIAILIGSSMAGFNKMMKSADRARGQELVSNVATALTALYEKDGCWPKKIREMSQQDDSMLDEETARVLGTRKLMALTVGSDGKLGGLDRFGIVTPWARKVLERSGSGASISDKVGSKTVENHILRFKVDLDGNGITELGTGVSSSSKKYVRATVAVWSCDKDGSDKSRDIIKSWTTGQETDSKEY